MLLSQVLYLEGLYIKIFRAVPLRHRGKGKNKTDPRAKGELSALQCTSCRPNIIMECLVCLALTIMLVRTSLVTFNETSYKSISFSFALLGECFSSIHVEFIKKNLLLKISNC